MRLPVPSRPQVRHPSLLRRQTQAHREPCNGLESMNPVQNLVKRTCLVSSAQTTHVPKHPPSKPSWKKEPIFSESQSRWSALPKGPRPAPSTQHTFRACLQSFHILRKLVVMQLWTHKILAVMMEPSLPLLVTSNILDECCNGVQV
jgi:hypothetical protein